MNKDVRPRWSGFLYIYLDVNSLEYTLSITSEVIDTFHPSFHETKEKCCGQTFWLDSVKFNHLETYIDDSYNQFLGIIVE